MGQIKNIKLHIVTDIKIPIKMATSFKKKSSRGRGTLPPGVKPSLHNNQLLVSTGCPSLDTLLGGGIAVGTLMLVEEDTHQSYTQVIKKLFIGEGVMCNHSLYLASTRDGNPEDMLKEIPRGADEDKTSESQSNKSNEDNADDLQIAWRYRNKPKVDTPSNDAQFGHYFDLSETISVEKIRTLNYTCFFPKRENTKTEGVKVAYKNLLKSIQETIEKNNLSISNSTDVPGVMRIHISSLGSPLWSEKLITSEKYDPSLAWFLLSLRYLLRRSYCAAMVSIPTHLFEEKSFVSRIHHCADVVIHLESFAGSEKSQNPPFKEYHGLFHVKKVPHLNSICGSSIDTSDLAFKVKKKKFLIEKLHLPPHISETVSRSNALKPGAPLCSATTPVNDLLDF